MKRFLSRTLTSLHVIVLGLAMSLTPLTQVAATSTPPLVENFSYDYFTNAMSGTGQCTGVYIFGTLLDANGESYGTGNLNTNSNSLCVDGQFNFYFSFSYWGVSRDFDYGLQNTVRIYNNDAFQINTSLPYTEVTFTRLDPTITNTGSDVFVSAAPGVQLTFDTISGSGQTTATATAETPELPSGFSFGDPPLYYDIVTTAAFAGDIEVCIKYSADDFIVAESDLRMLHYHNEVWEDITSSVDTVNDVLCGVTQSFSGFGIASKANFQPLITTVRNMNIQQGILNSLDKKLQDARGADDASDTGNKQATAGKLNAFMSEVEAQRNNKITSAQADELIDMATQLLTYFD